MRAAVRRTDDRGASAVEFALVVPILLTVVFGIINFGFVFSQQTTLNNAVREGARRAVVADPSAPRTCDGIIASVQNDLAGLGIVANQVGVKVTQDGSFGGNGCGGTFQTTTFGASAGNEPCRGSFNETNNESRSIIVEAEFDSDLPVAFPPFPTTIKLTSKAVYRCEFDS